MPAPDDDTTHATVGDDAGKNDSSWARRRLQQDRRYGLRLTLMGLGIALLAVPFSLLLLLVETGWQPLYDLDHNTAQNLRDWMAPRPDVTAVVQFFSDWVWDPATFRVVVFLVVVWLWFRGARRLAAWAVVTMASAALIGALMKVVVERARPHLANPVDTAPGWSFPSGHAMTGMVGSGVLLLVLLPMVPKKWRPVAWGLALFSAIGVGLTRIALGVHYVTDVTAGWVLGLAVLATTSAAFEMWRRDSGLRDVDYTQEGLEPELDDWENRDPEHDIEDEPGESDHNHRDGSGVDRGHR